MRCLIYTRISADPTGAQTATHRQEEACRSYALSRGWDVDDVVEDVDLSAYDTAVIRPGFEDVCVRAEAGLVDVVLVWKLDRLVRQPYDFERFWAAAQHGQVAVSSVTEPIDTTSELGVAIARMLVVFAGMESATKSVRLRAKQRERALAGKPHTTTRVYGYEKGWQTTVPAEAAVIVECARRVLDGEQLQAIARDLNRREIRSLRGRAWSTTTLRTLLLSNRLAGERWFEGKPVATGDWPAILDPETAARLRLLLADRRRRRTGTGDHPHLLSGVLRCGRCGSLLYAGSDDYGCRTGRPAGCGGITVASALVEAWFLGVLRWHVARPRHHRIYNRRRDPALTIDQAAALQRLSIDFYAHRRLSDREFEAARAAIVGTDEIRQFLTIPANATTRLAAWDKLSDRSRVQLVADLVETVVVHHSRPGVRFDPSRFEIHWRDGRTGHGDDPATTPAPPDRPRARPPRARRDPPPARGRWLTPVEAARRLDVGPNTIRRWVASRFLDGFDNDGHLIVDSASVKEFIDGARAIPRRPSPYVLIDRRRYHLPFQTVHEQNGSRAGSPTSGQ